MVRHEEQTDIAIGLIGMGSRGLSTLERVLSNAEGLDRNINIFIFEPNQLGCGVHNSDQRDYLLLNTVASQLGMFPDKKTLSGLDKAKPRDGLNFYEWCLSKDIKIDHRGRVTSDGKKVEKMDFLPRRLLGQYLADFYIEILKDLPKNVNITVFNEEAIAIKPGMWSKESDSQGFQIIGNKNSKVNVDRLVLTTGHGINNKNTCLNKIDKNQPLLIKGLGLTAMDQIAELTQGRGGKFIYEHGKCIYIPSNEEPKIYMQSRGGLTFLARPNMPENRKGHLPVVFTKERIDRMRIEKSNKLDFDIDILPLMIIEMRCAALAVNISNGCQESIIESNLYMRNIGESLETGIKDINDFLELKEDIYGKPNLEELIYRQLPSNLPLNGYQEWIVSSLKDDLEQSKIGINFSAIKAAAETWRDLRENLRYVVNYKGLNIDSHRRFYKHWVGVINRLVAGPQKERIEDLIALIESGVITLLHPDAEVEQYILDIDARVNLLGLCGQQKGILSDLRDMGKIRSVIAEPGYDGLEVDPNSNAVGKDGSITQNLWVLGPLVEGSTYYNHYIPTTGRTNRAITDAHKVAIQVLDQN